MCRDNVATLVWHPEEADFIYSVANVVQIGVLRTPITQPLSCPRTPAQAPVYGVTK